MSDTAGGTDRVYVNGLYPNYWPDDWDEKDIEFVAELLRKELNVTMEKRYREEPQWVLEAPESWGYFGRGDDE